jgi:hypothetical protein
MPSLQALLALADSRICSRFPTGVCLRCWVDALAPLARAPFGLRCATSISPEAAGSTRSDTRDLAPLENLMSPIISNRLAPTARFKGFVLIKKRTRKNGFFLGACAKLQERFRSASGHWQYARDEQTCMAQSQARNAARRPWALLPAWLCCLPNAAQAALQCLAPEVPAAPPPGFQEPGRDVWRISG